MFYEYCTRVSNTHDFMGNLNCGFAAIPVIHGAGPVRVTLSPCVYKWYASSVYLKDASHIC